LDIDRGGNKAHKRDWIVAPTSRTACADYLPELADAGSSATMTACAQLITLLVIPSHISALHRIDVNVVDVTLEVRVIADCMLPKSSLPDSRFAPSSLAPRSQLRSGQIMARLQG
jgi:hypothetical protein